MKPVINSAGHIPIPEPTADQVLIKLVLSGSNPKRLAASGNIPVAAFHELFTPGGSYAEFAAAPSHTAFHLQAHVSFEAATIPLAAMTAALPATSPIPLIVYGASTVLAHLRKGAGFVGTLLDQRKGNAVVNYRNGIDATLDAIKTSLEKKTGHSAAHHAIDAINNLSVHNQAYYERNAELGYIFARYLTRALQDRTFCGHPFEVRLGGLKWVEEALEDLKANKASVCKYIFRIAEIPGLEERPPSPPKSAVLESWRSGEKPGSRGQR
ncbi:hypothetical protein BJX64DRAFT_281186 [Aspergillus heterothallicus]